MLKCFAVVIGLLFSSQALSDEFEVSPQHHGCWVSLHLDVIKVFKYRGEAERWCRDYGSNCVIRRYGESQFEAHYRHKKWFQESNIDRSIADYRRHVVAEKLYWNDVRHTLKFHCENDQSGGY